MNKYLSKNNILILITVIAIIITAFTVLKNYNMAAQQPAKMPPLTIQAIKLKSQTVKEYEELPGRLTASKFSEIRPQVSGIIIKRSFEEGGTVKQGDQLYQIDDREYLTALNSAKAELARAVANHKVIADKTERYRKLVKLDAVSKQNYEDLISNLAAAQAEVQLSQSKVKNAEINVGYTKVFAPISGRIGKSNFTEGALVTANQAEPLTTITNLDPIYIDLSQAGRDLNKIHSYFKNGNEIPVSIYLGDGETLYDHTGILKFAEVTIDETTGNINLRAEIANPDLLLLPGLFVRAKLDLGTKQVLLVPQQAAMRNPDGSLMVYILSPDNKAVSQLITIESAVQDQWIVKSGLKEGDVVLTENMKLQPNMEVTPIFNNDKTASISNAPSQESDSAPTNKGAK